MRVISPYLVNLVNYIDLLIILLIALLLLFPALAIYEQVFLMTLRGMTKAQLETTYVDMTKILTVVVLR